MISEVQGPVAQGRGPGAPHRNLGSVLVYVRRMLVASIGRIAEVLDPGVPPRPALVPDPVSARSRTPGIATYLRNRTANGYQILPNYDASGAITVDASPASAAIAVLGK